MNKFAWVLVVVMAVAGLVVGCDKTGDSGKGSVAVVDFVNLQTQLGVAGTVQGHMQAATKDLNEKFNAVAQPIVTEAKAIDAEAAVIIKDMKLPTPMTQGDQEKLAANPELKKKVEAFQAKQNALRELQAKYQDALNGYRQQLEEAWRASLEPAMSKVAADKGFKVIIPKAGSAYVAADADLTAALEAHIKAVGVPKFNAPPTTWPTLTAPK